MGNHYRVAESTEPILSEGTKQLQMVRGALVVLDLEEKIKKKLKVYAVGEKNGQKRVMQMLDQKTRYIS